mmetsp:Transcript_115084/g.330646  ORF Transcript_115084/g.330646 Transcript_115084/m.330646 type:complete len:97 (+) Transcript_115084:361-651(+)
MILVHNGKHSLQDSLSQWCVRVFDNKPFYHIGMKIDNLCPKFVESTFIHQGLDSQYKRGQNSFLAVCLFRKLWHRFWCLDNSFIFYLSCRIHILHR